MKLKSFLFLLLSLVLVVTILVYWIYFRDKHEERVVLKSRTLVAPTPRGAALQALTEVPVGTRQHIILQLDHIPSPDTRTAFSASGIILLQYLPDHGWYAAVQGGIDVPEVLLERIRGSWSIEPQDRLAPGLAAGRIPAHAVAPDDLLLLTVLAFEDADLDALQSEIIALGGSVPSISAPFRTLFVRLPRAALSDLASIDAVHWIEPVAPRPGMEMSRARGYLTNTSVQAAPYSLTGAGVQVSMHEDQHAFQHTDLSARWIQGDTAAGEALSVGQHASSTAGTIAGNGTLNPSYKGMAPSSSVVTYAYGSQTDPLWESNNYSDIADALQRGMDVANNSWGSFGCNDEPYGDYTAKARVFDQQVLGRDDSGNAIGNPMVVTFSGGNERWGYFVGGNKQLDCITDTVAPYLNYRTVNQPKPAKNIIVVGAIDSVNDRMSTFSSWGPVSDGRLRPDIVAAGLHNGTSTAGVSDLDNCFGLPVGSSNQQCYRTTNNSNTSFGGYAWYSQTSAAAAMVSGNAAVFIEDFRAQTSGSNPLPSTVKAHFIHSARDLDDGTSWYNPGPDYASGYGLLNIREAIDQLRTAGWVEGSINQGETDTLRLSVPNATPRVKATLVWDDAPASPSSAGPALVNDLDLIVTDPAGVRHYPWTLDPAAPAVDAVRTTEDHLNNVEMVLVDGPIDPGIWTVEVAGTTVPSGPQSYSIVFSPKATCGGSAGSFRDRTSFQQTASPLTLIDFDTEPSGNPISADSPGILVGNRYSALGVNFSAGVIFGEPNLPFFGVSPPNSISNSGINTPTTALVDGSFAGPVCAVGITNVGARAVLRIFDASNNLISSITSDTDSNTKDFLGLLSSTPIHRFEFDFVSGIGFEGDDLLFGMPPQP